MLGNVCDVFSMCLHVSTLRLSSTPTLHSFVQKHIQHEESLIATSLTPHFLYTKTLHHRYSKLLGQIIKVRWAFKRSCSVDAHCVLSNQYAIVESCLVSCLTREQQRSLPQELHVTMWVMLPCVTICI